MRVGVFTDTDFDTASGAATTLQSLVACAPEDIRPRIYTFADLEVDEADFVALRRPAVTRLLQLAKRIADDRIRVIQLTGAGMAGLAARYLAFRAGVPLIGSVHAPAASRRARWLYRSCLRVLVPSEAASRQAAAEGWGDRAVVWKRGVDAQRFCPARRCQRVRDGWHVSERRPAILVSGRLSPGKGLALVESLSALLHHQRVPHRFIVLGMGPLLPALRERCLDAYFTGRVSHDDAASAMASADLLVYPSETDSGSTLLLEAQASGLPVLVTDAGSAQENMLPGRTGYVCRAGDVPAFAARAAALLVDRDHRQQFGEAARQYAAIRSWEVSHGPVYALYRAAGQGRLPVEPRTPRTRAWTLRTHAGLLSPWRHRRSPGHR